MYKQSAILPSDIEKINPSGPSGNAIFPSKISHLQSRVLRESTVLERPDCNQSSSQQPDNQRPTQTSETYRVGARVPLCLQEDSHSQF